MHGGREATECAPRPPRTHHGVLKGRLPGQQCVRVELELQHILLSLWPLPTLRAARLVLVIRLCQTGHIKMFKRVRH